MKIQTEQNKPHRKQMSIDQEFKVSFTIINTVLQQFTNKNKFEDIRDKLEYTMWI